MFCPHGCVYFCVGTLFFLRFFGKAPLSPLSPQKPTSSALHLHPNKILGLSGAQKPPAQGRSSPRAMSAAWQRLHIEPSVVDGYQRYERYVSRHEKKKKKRERTVPWDSPGNQHSAIGLLRQNFFQWFPFVGSYDGMVFLGLLNCGKWTSPTVSSASLSLDWF